MLKTPMSEEHMPSSYDAQTNALLYRVTDSALLELARSPAMSVARKAATIAQITEQLMAAADNGERDPARLKRRALFGIDRITP